MQQKHFHTKQENKRNGSKGIDLESISFQTKSNCHLKAKKGQKRPQQVCPIKVFKKGKCFSSLSNVFPGVVI